ncbi:ASP-4 protein, partial [Aphelenchoides avenae]
LGHEFPQITHLRFGLETRDKYSFMFLVPQIIGLGPLSKKYALASVLVALNRHLKRSIFSVWIAPVDLKDDEWSVPASITFGDIDRHCDRRDVVYANQKSAKYDNAHTWGFQLGSIRIEHNHNVVEIDVHATAAIMTLPSFVLGPQAVLDKLANAIGAVPDPYGYGLYLVECKNRTKLPPVKFNVGQRDIWIPQEDYVIGNDEDDQCALIFVATVDPATRRKSSPWLFGIPILSRYCPLFDFGKDRVGFAQIKSDFGGSSTHMNLRSLHSIVRP